MHAFQLLALGSGLSDTLTWLAFIGLAGLALILYLPQRFSGPLTEHERRAVRGGLRHRAVAVVIAAPVATLAGFFLILPPMVELHVPSHATQTNTVGMSQIEASAWSWLSSRVSTWEWTRSVRCHLKDGVRGEEAIVDALLAAAADGFVDRKDCRLAEVNAWELASIELSLVELAARAYVLSDVLISAGPRLHDPDPWDVMAQSLQARGVQVHFTERGELADPDPDVILRLTRARLRDEGAPVEALALIQGDSCKVFSANLIAPDGVILDRCNLSAFECDGSDRHRQRMLRIQLKECNVFTTRQAFLAHRGGILLSAGYGETPVRMSDRLVPLGVMVEGPQRAVLAEALSQIEGGTGAFADELKQRALRGLHVETTADIRIDLGLIVELRGPSPLPEHCDAPVGHGPFFGSGPERPVIKPQRDRVTISAPALRLDRSAPDYDPTAMYALLSAITWAANALDSGICGEREEPPATSTRRPAYPLLNTSQLDEAVGALRRERHSLGLALLAVAVLSLALSLRRSVR